MNPHHGLNIFLTVRIFILVAAFSATAHAAETYKLDPGHSSVVFRVKHLGVAFVYGRFSAPTGTFVFDASSPSNSTITMQVDANKVDTAVAKRDTHLKSPDFLNADAYPLVSFKSTSVKKLDTVTYEVTGTLTLLGKTLPITVQAKETGSGKDPWGNYRRGFEASFSIKRTDFGMDFMLNAASDLVEMTVSVEGIRQ